MAQWHSIFVRSELEPSEHSDDYSSTSLVDERLPALRLGEPGLSSTSLLTRELGVSRTQTRISSPVKRNLKSCGTWTGASKDVLSVAWNEDGSGFAAGSSADHMDEHGMPYNRNNNLVFGDLSDGGKVFELPNHHVPRHESRPSSGERIADPRLFTTVCQVTFAQHHPTLYSAGYDRTVRIWDTQRHHVRTRPKCLLTLRHDKHVDFAIQMPTRSADDPQVLATGQQTRDNPIQLFGLPNNRDLVSENSISIASTPLATFSSERAQSFSIVPSALEFGPNYHTRRYLLAGFSEPGNALGDREDREGHVTIWDVTRPKEALLQLRGNTETVFDVAWQPGRFVIAAATSPHNKRTLTHKHNTNSVIRTWSPTESPNRLQELECPARDVNDVQFHPTRDLITASCTDGRIYVWDYRRTDQILSTLEHGVPIETFESGQREERDVGVRFCSWADNGRYLYTGGSDGRLACWDVLAVGEFEQASVQEVAKFDAGIMAGAFTKDESKLLLGLVKGSIEVLTVGASSVTEAIWDKHMVVSDLDRPGTFDYAPAETFVEVEEVDDDTLGIRTARDLLESGQLTLHPKYGVGQGPNYQGPWKMSARLPGCTDPSTGILEPNVAAQQFFRTVREEGRRNGGWAQNAGRDRLLAKKYQMNAFQRRRKHAGHSSEASQGLSCDEERVKGPDTIQFASLAELAKYGGEDGVVLLNRDQTAQVHATIPARPLVSIKREVASPSSAKRAATEELNSLRSKRSQTLKSSSVVHEQRSRSEAPNIMPQQPEASHRTSPMAYRPVSQLPVYPFFIRNTSGQQPAPRETNFPSQLEIIDLCDSDDDNDDSDPVLIKSDYFPKSHIPSQNPQIALHQARPSSGNEAEGLVQASTPSRKASRPPAAVDEPHADAHQSVATPHTPSRQLPEEQWVSPSSRDSAVVRSSPGKHGFVIPPRILPSSGT